MAFRSAESVVLVQNDEIMRPKVEKDIKTKESTKTTTTTNSFVKVEKQIISNDFKKRSFFFNYYYYSTLDLIMMIKITFARLFNIIISILANNFRRIQNNFNFIYATNKKSNFLFCCFIIFNSIVLIQSKKISPSNLEGFCR